MSIPRLSGVAAACLLVGLTTGCSQAPRTSEVVVEPPSAAPSAGEEAAGQDDAASSATSGSTERSVTTASDGTTLVTGDQASFVMPSGNIQCVMRAASVVCQISEKDFDPAQDDLDPQALGECDTGSADAVTVLAGGRATWGCTSETIRGQAALDLGGWWAADGVGDTEEVDGTDLAVLTYDSSLQVGSMLCRSSFTDVTCRDLDSSHGFTLAREAYSTS